jgi:hypothetical protein
VSAVRALACLAFTVGFATPAGANFVFGCAADGGKIPHLILRVLDEQLREIGRYDSTLDFQWGLSSIIQLPLADSLLVVEYIGVDRRAAYGASDQRASVEFADLLPPDKAGKHPAGRAGNIPVGEMRPVVDWLGSATFLSISGSISDGAGNTPCQWFCQIDIDWRPLAVVSRSFGRIKALYDTLD